MKHVEIIFNLIYSIIQCNRFCCCCRTLRRSSTLTSEKDRSNEKDEVKGNKGREAIRAVRRLSTVSNATLTNVSAMSQICSRSDPVKYFLISSSNRAPFTLLARFFGS